MASPIITEYLIPHWLLSLQSTESNQPGITPRVDVTAANSVQAEASVRDGSADLGFVERPHPPTGLGTCVVGTDELVVVVLPNHKWARRSRPVSPLELAQTPLVSREHHSGVRDLLTSALRRALGSDIQPVPPLLELPSPGAVRAAVLAGAGPAAVSRLAVADDLSAGRLQRVAVRSWICDVTFGRSGVVGVGRLPVQCATCSATSVAAAERRSVQELA